MIERSMRLPWVLAALAIAGCSDADSQSGSPLDIWMRVAEARCAFCERCPLPDWLAVDTSPYERCVAIQRNVVEHDPRADPGPDWEAAVRRGTAVWNDAHVAACLRHLAEAPCDVGWDYRHVLQVAHPECTRLMQGRVPPSGACYIDEECDGGYCTSGACPGQCVAVGAPGDSCRADEQCPPGTRCDVAATGRCVEGLAPSPAAEGEICSPSFPPFGGCAWGLVCGADGVCRRLAAEGGSCEHPGECEPWSTCTPGGPGSTCQAIALATREDLECSAAAVCDRAIGLRCDSGTGRCVGPAAAGESCSFGEDCAASLGCLGGVCAERRGDGESCAEHLECNSGVCESGLCAPFGERCIVWL